MNTATTDVAYQATWTHDDRQLCSCVCTSNVLGFMYVMRDHGFMQCTLPDSDEYATTRACAISGEWRQTPLRRLTPGEVGGAQLQTHRSDVDEGHLRLNCPGGGNSWHFGEDARRLPCPDNSGSSRKPSCPLLRSLASASQRATRRSGASVHNGGGPGRLLICCPWCVTIYV